MVFLPPAAFSLRGWLHLWSSPRRRRYVAPSPLALTLSSAPTPFPPFRRLPAHPRCADRHRRLLLLRRWRSVYDGLARAFSNRAFLAALLRGFLSPPAYTLSGARGLSCVGRAVSLLWRGPRVVPVPRLLFIFAASIRLRLRGCGRATLHVLSTSLWGLPKVNMSRRVAASMYANFLCASSCSYFFLSPAPQLSSCGVPSPSLLLPLKNLR